MILPIISVDLIIKVFNLFYIISDFTIMTMKEKAKTSFVHSTTVLLISFSSSLSFLSFLLFSSFGRHVNLLIQCCIQLRINGMLNIQ